MIYSITCYTRTTHVSHAPFSIMCELDRVPRKERDEVR